MMIERKETNYSDTLNPKEMKDLILRVTESEKYADLFRFIKISKTKKGYDEYEMYDENGNIIIAATSGIAAAVAFNTYLTKYCHSYFGPLTKNIKLPDTPPKINGRVHNKSVFLYRYFMNYCTFGYSLIFAGWQEFERLTDWMLLSGVNLMLNIVGHEIVWRDTLRDLGYSNEEINSFICGPAYLPWQWMGNTTKIGGNLSDSWYEQQKILGNKINEKMRSFGAEIMVPGYFGMVPINFKEKFPESQPIIQGIWCDAATRPDIITTNDPMFDKVSELFYGNLKKNFGDFYYFSGDPFHEGGVSDGVSLAEYGASIIEVMKKYYPTGVWSLQGWGDNPRKEILQKMNKEDIIICELSSDKNYDTPKSYEEYPWIYSVTTNFGGTRIIDGDVNAFLTEPYQELSKQSSNMVGIGMTMEAIATDEILYSVLTQNAIKENSTSLTNFVDEYISCRYNTSDENVKKAIHIIAERILRADRALRKYGGRESVLCARPDLNADRVSISAGSLKISYDEKDLNEALQLLFSGYDELKDNESYRFDIMDVARQTVSNKSWHILDRIKAAYENYDFDCFIAATEEFLSLYDIQEKLLSTNKHTMLGYWVKMAEDYANTPKEKQEFVFIAKNMITLWAEKEESDVLRDYAYKEWSGMMPFYKKRWSTYFNLLKLYFDRRDEMPEINWKEIDFNFLLSEEKYPYEPFGDLKSAVDTVMNI